MKKRLLSLVLALAMCLGLFPAAALAEGPATSGKYFRSSPLVMKNCDISWRFDPASGTLTVTHNALCNDPHGCVHRSELTGTVITCAMVYPYSSFPHPGAIALDDQPRPWSHWEEDVRRVVLDGPITEVVNGAFRDLPNLREVVIPEGVAVIGESAFENCTALEKVELPNSLKRIERAAFAHCTSLAELSLPEGLEEIRCDAFYYCSSLTRVTFPEHPITFTLYSSASPGDAGDVFPFCAALNLAQLESIATTATQNLPNGAVLSADGTALLRAAPGMETIPDTVTRIGPGAFWNNSGVRQVTVPDRVTSVGAQAFAGCPDLVSVSLPDSVTLAAPPMKPYSAQSGAKMEPHYAPGVIGDVGVSSLMASVTSGGDLLSAEVFCASPKLQRVIFRPTDRQSKFAENFFSYRDYNFTRGQDVTVIGNIPDCHTDMGGNWKITAGLDPSKFVLSQNERITALSNTICDGIADPYDKAEAIFTWAAKNIEYDYDYVDEKKDTVAILPDEVLDSKLTVCDGYARLTQALLQAQGIPAVFIGGSSWTGNFLRFSDGTLKRKLETHAWNAAYINGSWIYIDSTWGRPWVGSINPITKERTGHPGFDPDQFDLPLYILSQKHFGKYYTADPYAIYADQMSTDFSRTVTPNRAAVLVNGKKVDFEAYNVNGNNYFKLRDVAQAITGSGKQFEVTWDGEKGAINLISDRPYTTVGGELVPGDGSNKTATANAPVIYLDGAQFFIGAYEVNGNNYVKLRDLGQALNFNVSWDEANNAIFINTGESYTPD